MSELSKKYKNIMDKLDKNITDEKQLEFVKSMISELSIIFIDIIDRMSEIVEERVTDVEEGQKDIIDRLSKIESSVNNIENELCDDSAETEIVCPYCNKEFLAELDDKLESDVECPECHNIIELGMSFDSNVEATGCKGCEGKCGFCNNCDDDNSDYDF